MGLLTVVLLASTALIVVPVAISRAQAVEGLKKQIQDRDRQIAQMRQLLAARQARQQELVARLEALEQKILQTMADESIHAGRLRLDSEGQLLEDI
jgi:uncharacterized protein YlxW (UPF0749 family)